MRFKSLMVVAVFCAAARASAQAPSSLGTAAGVAGTGVTKARRADAALWNPALVGIYDGPQRTTSLFAVDAATLPRGRAFDAAARLGLLSGRVEEDRLGFLSGPIVWGSGDPEADLQVRWAAVQSRGLAISLDTRFAASASLPEGLADHLGLDGVAQETWQGGSTSRSLSSVLTVARGTFLGELPVFGRVWAGGAVKGWWVHEFATGAFQADLPAVDVYRETALGKVGGAGFDVGVAGRTTGRVWYGVAVSNVYATSFRPGSGARTRQVQAVDVDGTVEFRQTWSAPIRDDDPDPDAVARAERAVGRDAVSRGASCRACLGESMGDGRRGVERTTERRRTRPARRGAREERRVARCHQPLPPRIWMGCGEIGSIRRGLGGPLQPALDGRPAAQVRRRVRDRARSFALRLVV